MGEVVVGNPQALNAQKEEQTMELKELIEQLRKEWEVFKAEHDRALKEREATGRIDAVTEEKLNKHNEAIGALQKQIDALTAKLNRPGVTEDLESGAEKKEYRKLYNSYLRRGDDKIKAQIADLQQKLLQIGVEADGGLAVPEELDRTIGRMELDAMPMEALVDSMVSGGESYEKVYDLGGTESGWVGETAPRVETDTAKLGSFKPMYGELYAFPFATQKMLDDAFFDVEAWLAVRVAEKFAQDIDKAIIDGNGVNKVRGILSHTLVTTSDATRPFGQIQMRKSGASADFDGDDLIDLIHDLKPAYRQNARFLMAGATAAKVRKLKDSTGNYIWQPSLQLGQPSMLLGYPLTEDEHIPAVGAASKSILFGDFKRAYKFFNVRGIRVLRDPYTVKGKVGFYTTKRVGGGVEDTSAIKVLSLEA